MRDLIISGGLFDLEKISNEIKSLEEDTMEEGFYNDRSHSEKVFNELNRRKYWIEKISLLDELKEEIDLILEMIEEDPDSIDNELETVFKKFSSTLDEVELKSMLSGEEDKRNAIFTIHAGSGGTDAQDWAHMLLRLYKRFFDKMDFKYSEVDYLAGDLIGTKSVTFEVSGNYPYGFLKSEHGVHRLIRLSPFDTQHKRHTSFASISVMPVADDVEIDLDLNDLRIDTYRASGAGGQHVNKTDSAVRITHIPTNTVVQSQAQRSQVVNKEYALKVLKAKLYQMKLEEEKKKWSDIGGEKLDISWGSQIRTYTFHPYNMVKDHRTNYDTSNTQSVMDGEIEDFIKEYLHKFGKKY